MKHVFSGSTIILSALVFMGLGSVAHAATIVGISTSITRGEPATISWVQSGGADQCKGKFIDAGNGDYPDNGDGVNNFWTFGFRIGNSSVSKPFWGDLSQPFPQKYTFTCTDTSVPSAIGEATITINGCTGSDVWNTTTHKCAAASAPTVNAGSDVTLAWPQTSHTVSGATASDPDGPVTVGWSVGSCPGGSPTFINQTTLTPTVSNLPAGVPCEIVLTGTDPGGIPETDPKIITVTTPPPTASFISGATCPIGAGMSSCTTPITFTSQYTDPAGVDLTDCSGTVIWSAAEGDQTRTVSIPHSGSCYQIYKAPKAPGDTKLNTVDLIGTAACNPATSSWDATAGKCLPLSYPITITQSPGGTITSFPVATVPRGGSVTYTSTPDGGNTVFNLIVNSISVPTPYTQTNVQTPQVVTGSFTPIPVTADLVPAAPTASPSSVAQGGTVNVTALIKNIGAVDAGPYKIGEFFIDWTGDGFDDARIPASPVPGGTLKEGGTSMTTGTWAVPGAQLVGGNYRIAYYVDTGDGVNDDIDEGIGDGPWNYPSNWSGWSAPFAVTASGGGTCNPATFLDGCSLPNGADGDVYNNSCTRGWTSGTCSYTCDGLTTNWTRNPGSSCKQPVITRFEICDDAAGTIGCSAVPPGKIGGTKNVAAGAPFFLHWDSDNTDKCVNNGIPGDFSTGDARSGKDGLTASLIPGTAYKYKILCSMDDEGITADAKTMTLNVDSVTPDISISPSDTMVRVGTPILVIWKTNGNDPASCTLTGGTLGSQNPISRDGSFNQTITGRTTFKITCGGKQDQITVDVIPDGTET